MKSKGQFMMISAVVIGLIVISVGTAIKHTQNRQVTNTDTAYLVNNIKLEASKADFSKANERRNFEKLVEMTSSYGATATYWNSGGRSCYNVTLIRTTRRIDLTCIK
ncbi:MAG: hypothetical protein ABEJ99_03715 [Candidatus Nanohaloarchaea archaeon]